MKRGTTAAELRPSRLSSGKHLRKLSAIAGCRRRHQPPAARRAYGVRTFARRHFRGTVAGRRTIATGRTLGIDAEYGSVVMAVDIIQIPVLSDNYEIRRASRRDNVWHYVKIQALH